MNSNPIEKGVPISPAASIPTGFIDAAKLGKGLNTVFKGYALIFEAMADQAELLSSMVQQTGAAGQVAKKEPAKVEPSSADTAKENPQNDNSTPPWEDNAGEVNASETPASQNAKSEPVAITVDDLLKVAAQKITTNRKNSPKIKALLASYGCAAISELPEDKREAFLNDLAQL